MASSNSGVISRSKIKILLSGVTFASRTAIHASAKLRLKRVPSPEQRNMPSAYFMKVVSSFRALKSSCRVWSLNKFTATVIACEATSPSFTKQLASTVFSLFPSCHPSLTPWNSATNSDAGRAGFSTICTKSWRWSFKVDSSADAEDKSARNRVRIFLILFGISVHALLPW